MWPGYMITNVISIVGSNQAEEATSGLSVRLEINMPINQMDFICEWQVSAYYFLFFPGPVPSLLQVKNFSFPLPNLELRVNSK